MTHAERLAYDRLMYERFAAELERRLKEWARKRNRGEA